MKHDGKCKTFTARISDAWTCLESIACLLHVKKLKKTRMHSSKMRTDRAVIRMSSDQVAMRPIVDRMTDAGENITFPAVSNEPVKYETVHTVDGTEGRGHQTRVTAWSNFPGFFLQFSGGIGKNIRMALLGCRPPSGKSWIRHCIPVQDMKNRLMSAAIQKELPCSFNSTRLECCSCFTNPWCEHNTNICQHQNRHVLLECNYPLFTKNLVLLMKHSPSLWDVNLIILGYHGFLLFKISSLVMCASVYGCV